MEIVFAGNLQLSLCSDPPSLPCLLPGGVARFRFSAPLRRLPPAAAPSGDLPGLPSLGRGAAGAPSASSRSPLGARRAAPRGFSLSPRRRAALGPVSAGLSPGRAAGPLQPAGTGPASPPLTETAEAADQHVDPVRYYFLQSCYEKLGWESILSLHWGGNTWTFLPKRFTIVKIREIFEEMSLEGYLPCQAGAWRGRSAMFCVDGSLWRVCIGIQSPAPSEDAQPRVSLSFLGYRVQIFCFFMKVTLFWIWKSGKVPQKLELFLSLYLVVA